MTSRSNGIPPEARPVPGAKYVSQLRGAILSDSPAPILHAWLRSPMRVAVVVTGVTYTVKSGRLRRPARRAGLTASPRSGGEIAAHRGSPVMDTLLVLCTELR